MSERFKPKVPAQAALYSNLHALRHSSSRWGK
jgi:hypothetical protein